MMPGEYTVAADMHGQFWVVRLDPGEQVRGPIHSATEAMRVVDELNDGARDDA